MSGENITICSLEKNDRQINHTLCIHLMQYPPCAYRKADSKKSNSSSKRKVWIKYQVLLGQSYCQRNDQWSVSRCLNQYSLSKQAVFLGVCIFECYISSTGIITRPVLNNNFHIEFYTLPKIKISKKHLCYIRLLTMIKKRARNWVLLIKLWRI